MSIGPAPLGSETRKLREGEAFLLTDGANRKVVIEVGDMPTIRGQRKIIRRGDEIICRARFCGHRRYSIAAPGWTISRISLSSVDPDRRSA